MIVVLVESKFWDWLSFDLESVGVCLAVVEFWFLVA